MRNWPVKTVKSCFFQSCVGHEVDEIKVWRNYLNIIGRDEEGGPADHNEESTRQEVGDDVMGHFPLHVQLEMNNQILHWLK